MMRKSLYCFVFLTIFSLFTFSTQPAIADEPPGPGGGEAEDAPDLDPTPPERNEASRDILGSILVVTYDDNGRWSPQSLNVFDTLKSLGYDVTHLHNPSSGMLSTTLSSDSFEQVWIFDITTSLQISTSDAQAVADWYATNAKGNIIIDARSYGAFHSIVTDRFWIENEAHAFNERCGGLWIGTDHFPSWASNGNRVLNALEYTSVSGSLAPSSVVGNLNNSTANELLSVPNIIVPSNLHAFASPGIAPVGVQPDGTNLSRVLAANTPTGSALTSASLASNFCEDEDKPKINSINPPQPFACDRRQWLTIEGERFDSGSTVLLSFDDGPPFAPISEETTPNRFRFIENPGRFRVFVGLIEAGTWAVKVIDSQGNESDPVSFTVQPIAPGLGCLDDRLISLIDLYAPRFHNEKWDISPSQFKAWIALLSMKEAGELGYAAHSRAGNCGFNDCWPHNKHGTSFHFSTGIGVFQLDNGGSQAGSQGGARESWETMPTLHKMDPVLSILSLLRWHRDRFSNVTDVDKVTLEDFSEHSAWCAMVPYPVVRPIGGGKPVTCLRTLPEGFTGTKYPFASAWESITGSEWDPSEKMNVEFNVPSKDDPFIGPTGQDDPEGSIVYLGKRKWFLWNSEGEFQDTWLINARGQSDFQYYYTYGQGNQNKEEAWAYKDSADLDNPVDYFRRSYDDDAVAPQNPVVTNGETAEERVLDPAPPTDGESPEIAVGQGVSDQVALLFIEAFSRNGGSLVMGYPINEVHRWGNGWIQDFREGEKELAIMKPDGVDAAFAIYGAIWQKFKSVGGPLAVVDVPSGGTLGYPISPEFDGPGGPRFRASDFRTRVMQFQGGWLYWHADEFHLPEGINAIPEHAGKTVFVGHGIHEHWQSIRFGRDSVGLPVSDEMPIGPSGANGFDTTGILTDFQNGRIYWHRNGEQAGRAFEVHGDIDSHHMSLGGATGWLGFPISDVNESEGALVSTFEGGAIRKIQSQPPQALPAVLGTVTARVFGTLSGPAEGIHLEFCPEPDSSCSMDVTDARGRYRVLSSKVGAHRITVRPINFEPELIPKVLTLDLEEDIPAVQDIELSTLREVPPQASIEPVRFMRGDIPSIYWRDTLTVTSSPHCPNGSGSFSIVQSGEILRNGTMEESPAGSGHYVGQTVPLFPLHGYASTEITIDCPISIPDETAEFDIYIDPSGLVIDQNGNPVAGATVTLSRSDSIDGLFEIVPDSSSIMSPNNRSNPDTTDLEGRFGWDVIAGFYIVRVEASGCNSPGDPAQSFVETDVLTIPPPVTDLLLVLDCNEPPTADAGGPYEANEGEVITLDASGSSDHDGTILSYGWDLDNDGEYDDTTGVNPEVTFDTAGSFTIGLRVTDDLGATGTDTAQVVVNEVDGEVDVSDRFELLGVENPPTGATAQGGIYPITGTFRYNGTSVLNNLFFEVTVAEYLDGGTPGPELDNRDQGTPPGVGAKLTIPLTEGVLNPGDIVEVTFEVLLPRISLFRAEATPFTTQ